MVLYNSWFPGHFKTVGLVEDSRVILTDSVVLPAAGSAVFQVSFAEKGGVV